MCEFKHLIPYFLVYTLTDFLLCRVRGVALRNISGLSIGIVIKGCEFCTTETYFASQSANRLCGLLFRLCLLPSR